MEYLTETEGFIYPLTYEKKSLKLPQIKIDDFYHVDPLEPHVLPSKIETKGGKQKIVSLIDVASPTSPHDSIKKKKKTKK